MEAVFDILRFFGNIFYFYIKSIQFVLGFIIKNQSWLDFLTIYLSIFIPILMLFSILVRKKYRVVFFNITIHIYCFILSLPIVFISKEGLIYKIDGVFQKNINGAFLFWFISIYGMLSLFNKIFVLETAGKRVVDYKNKNYQNNRRNENNNYRKKKRNRQNKSNQNQEVNTSKKDLPTEIKEKEENQI